MSKQFDNTEDAAELRQSAERRLAAKPADAADNPADAQRLVHELQVHQIELEMQNEALREARAGAEIALERYAELFDFAPIAYFILGCDGIVQQSNFRAGRLLGLERFRMAGQRFTNSVSREFRPVFDRFLEKTFAGDDRQSCEITLQAGENPLWVTIEAIADIARRTCLMAVLDIGERKRAEQELQLAATIYLALGEAIMVADENNRIVTVNSAFSRLTGYRAEEAIGQPTSLLKSGRQDKAFYQDMWGLLNTTGHWQGEIWNRRKNGDVYLEWLCISTVYGGNGEVIRRVAMFSDITEKKRAEEIIRKQANFDPLTGLPNRRLFHDRLQQAIKKSHRENRKVALMFLDIDHFKDVNDTLGHDVGDNLLKEAAQRLKGCIREADTLARPGGDEFTVILGELDELASIDRVAQCILHCIAAPFQLGNERCYVSVSIGITLYPDDSASMDDLLKKADQSMYAAKHQGRNRFCYFTPAMQSEAESRLRLANDLRGAMDGRQFWVAYQPIVELATGDIQKAEALIRWQHPTRGPVSPAEFIPIAEDTGLIIEVGEWVFRQAANQAAIWRASHRPYFQISVNKSPAQFYNDSDAPTDWFEQLQRLGLPGHCIAIEITEGLLLDASPGVAEKLLAFRDAGMQISLDDFGTGYSSLSYLKKFAIDYLKIDRAFVCNLSADSTDMALCEAMILMAHKLGMKVIAEGIETLGQRDLLLQAGCDYGQGYLFSRPVPAEEFEKLF
jgi:diguanylate cyclase (GGDEF)-like protein/PAS domain S-box-containing protein